MTNTSVEQSLLELREPAVDDSHDDDQTQEERFWWSAPLWVIEALRTMILGPRPIMHHLAQCSQEIFIFEKGKRVADGSRLKIWINRMDYFRDRGDPVTDDMIVKALLDTKQKETLVNAFHSLRTDSTMRRRVDTLTTALCLADEEYQSLAHVVWFDAGMDFTDVYNLIQTAIKATYSDVGGDRQTEILFPKFMIWLNFVGRITPWKGSNYAFELSLALREHSLFKAQRFPERG
uniref:RxLR effector candidate protein n=1 Tax=Hyaloperonospora arabidopsidis (strain Emoy2) TaxID=559515 RepID=M4B5X1_HYAAE